MRTFVITLLLVAFTTMTTAACNTMQGAGKDISRGGEKLENSAERNKHY